MSRSRKTCNGIAPKPADVRSATGPLSSTAYHSKSDVGRRPLAAESKYSSHATNPSPKAISVCAWGNVRFPEAHGSAAGGGEAAAVRAEGHAGERTRRPFQKEDFLGGDQVPDTDGAVLADADQTLPARM